MSRRTGGSTAILAVLSAAAIMATLDLLVVNVAFPSISRDFGGTSLADLTWVLNGYAVVYAAMLVPLGRLADRHGRLRGFIAGVVVFTLASAACAGARSLWVLVTFRAVQAVGAAALTPTSLGLLLAATPAAKRPGAVRTWATSGAIAAAAGPVIGGLLVQHSWRWIFIMNIPIGVLTLMLAVRLVPDSRDPAVTKRPDMLGAALLAVGVGAFALALVKAPAWGWAATPSLATFALGVLGVLAFLTRSAHHPLPVVELSLLRVRSFAWANVAGFLYSVAFGAALLAAVVWIQDVWHWSALRAGLAIAPAPLMVPIVSTLAQRLSRRFSAGAIASVGCAMFGVGAAYLAIRIGTTPRYLTDVLPGWLVVGAGAGVAMPTIFAAATAELPGPRAATGSAIVTMGRQIGLTLGVSLLVATVGNPGSAVAAQETFRHAWWGIAAVAALAAAAAVNMTSPRTHETRILAVRAVITRFVARVHLGPVENYVTR